MQKSKKSSSKSSTRRDVELNGMRYVVEYKDEAERDNANVVKAETRKTQISSGC